MAGHSAYKNIMHKKGRADAARAKLFAKIGREITVAAKMGSPDPGMNPRLRLAIQAGRAENMPKDNIERAIKKGTGELKGEQMQEIILEAYGPAGAAFIIECLSDNRNRTLANVKSIIGKHGGHVAEGNAVAWMFERKGLVVAELAGGLSPEKLEELELQLIDVGAEDFSAEGDYIRVVTSMTDWSKVKDFLKKSGWSIDSAGLSYVPKQKVPVTDGAMAEKASSFIEYIEEDDDVSEVHTNAEIIS